MICSDSESEEMIEEVIEDDNARDIYIEIDELSAKFEISENSISMNMR